MSSDHNHFMNESRRVAVSSLKSYENPSLRDVIRSAEILVKKRIDNLSEFMNPIDKSRFDETVDTLARCAMALVTQWHVTKRAERWPPNLGVSGLPTKVDSYNEYFNESRMIAIKTICERNPLDNAEVAKSKLPFFIDEHLRKREEQVLKINGEFAERLRKAQVIQGLSDCASLLLDHWFMAKESEKWPPNLKMVRA